MIQNALNAHIRVGYVLKRYPRFSETFVVNEILAHERSGLQIDIFALGPVEESHFQDGISRVRAPVTRLTDKQRNTESFWALLQRASRELQHFSTRLTTQPHPNVHELAQAVMLALAVQERGIQHLHAHFATRAATVTRLAALFSGVSWSFTAHAKDIYYRYETSTEIESKLRDAAQAITVSDYNLTYLRQRYGDDARRAIRIYNGIDLAQFPWQAPNHRPRQIFAVGRLVAKKGFDVLIAALHLLHQRGEHFHCTLTGDGPLREALLTQITRLGLNGQISLTGSRPQPDIIAAMREAAMLVAPCVISEEGDRDGLPTVLLEAMALGTPVISTQVAGIPELVSDQETGLCVESGNPQALANAIQRLLNDPALAAALSVQARIRIERNYDIERNSALLREVFTAAVASLA